MGQVVSFERRKGFISNKGMETVPKEGKESGCTRLFIWEYSIEEIIRKYEISTTSLLRRRINVYHGHSGLKGTGRRKSNSMIKGRDITWKERIKMAQDCLKNDKNY